MTGFTRPVSDGSLYPAINSLAKADLLERCADPGAGAARYVLSLTDVSEQHPVLRRRLEFLEEPASFFYDGDRPLRAEQVPDPYRRGMLLTARAISCAERTWLHRVLDGDEPTGNASFPLDEPASRPPTEVPSMLASWYDGQGPDADVRHVGDLPDPTPDPGEVRVRVNVSGINPGDTKKRRGWRGSSMPHPRAIPHSDAAGVIDAVGDAHRVGQRVSVYGAKSYRLSAPAAQFTVVPADLAVPLPDHRAARIGEAVLRRSRQASGS